MLAFKDSSAKKTKTKRVSDVLRMSLTKFFVCLFVFGWLEELLVMFNANYKIYFSVY